ncbi:MAG: formylglycine-generating enzyme family protein [Kiritimatiellae bacterium]|nr:formylglycine-generating enzyme family protein [Kiritimatiellia bacterium]
MKNLIPLSTILLAAAVIADPADPQISNVRLEQNSVSRRVTVRYDLDEAAVVTMDVLTNGVSIGGANIQAVTGDCFKKIAAGNDHEVTWDPYLSWPDHKFGAGVVSVRMTAWALDNTPDYMVVDISSAAQPNTQRYYPSVDFLPGGILSNQNYRTTKFVMRKIMAKGVEWTMGSTTLETARDATREATHQVTLTNNYYIGVFPVTQAQWDLIQPSRQAPSYYNNVADRAMRPVEQVCYNEIRTNVGTSTDANTAYYWPADPNPSSFLGKLRTKAGINFDLPSEAQWEFAARAGNGDTKWGDGSGILNEYKDTNLDLFGRYERNGGKSLNGSSYVDPTQSCGATNGTAIVGSYAPNAWGLYDTAGNVFEWCLDWYTDDITGIGGKVNIAPSTPANTLTGNPVSSAYRVIRGGSWNFNSALCRPAYRGDNAPANRRNRVGIRLVCTAGLQ